MSPMSLLAFLTLLAVIYGLRAILRVPAPERPQTHPLFNDKGEPVFYDGTPFKAP